MNIKVEIVFDGLSMNVGFEPHPMDWVLHNVSFNTVANAIAGINGEFEGRKVMSDEDAPPPVPLDVITPRIVVDRFVVEVRKLIQAGMVVADGVEALRVEEGSGR